MNGPLLQHSDGTVRTALKRMYGGAKHSQNKDGHFIRRAENIKDYLVSKTIDKFVSTDVKAPFML